MTTFGVGYGRDKNLLKSRPCNTRGSYGKQKFVNSWCEQDEAGDSFLDGRWCSRHTTSWRVCACGKPAAMPHA